MAKKIAYKSKQPKPVQIKRRGPNVVRLSQCMIVKNEEKNIEKALSWAKDVAYEQIVVDTGSTDRTVEIAESMGAKVYHFEWISDFSAAKNFAIEKASGNWIAFLDADEYFDEGDTLKLMQFLLQIESVPGNEHILTIRTPLWNLNDAGAVFSVFEQQRVFRNRKDIRYQNRIHEYLTIASAGSVFHTKEMKIYHTGYTAEAFAEGEKGTRNASILREELSRDPENLNLKGYLADALVVDGTITENIEEATGLYQEVVDSDTPLYDVVMRSAHDFLIRKALNALDVETVMDLSKRAMKLMPDNPDYPFYLGKVNYTLQNNDEAWDAYVKCENTIETAIALKNRITPENLQTMMHDMSRLAMLRQDYNNALHYTGLTLIMDKYTEDTLVALFVFFKVMRNHKIFADAEVVGYLQQYYDIGDPHDKLYLAKCAKAAGDDVMTILFYQLLTEADKAVLGVNG